MLKEVVFYLWKFKTMDVMWERELYKGNFSFGYMANIWSELWCLCWASGWGFRLNTEHRDCRSSVMLWINLRSYFLVAHCSPVSVLWMGKRGYWIFFPLSWPRLCIPSSLQASWFQATSLYCLFAHLSGGVHPRAANTLVTPLWGAFGPTGW